MASRTGSCTAATRAGGWRPGSARMNLALAPIHGQIEPAFGTLKHSYGWRRVRYRGLVRNGAHLQLLCIALNLRRGAEDGVDQGEVALRHSSRVGQSHQPAFRRGLH